MARKTLPSRELLRQLLSYDPDTGDFTWLPRTLPRWDSRYAGKSAGSIFGNGYRYIMLRRTAYLVHRLAWLCVHGDPIPAIIDHIDCDRLNNRIANLRAATDGQNNANSFVRKDSITGIKGIVAHGRGFKAQISQRGTNHYLGTFDTMEEAAEAYRDAAVRLHGAFARWD